MRILLLKFSSTILHKCRGHKYFCGFGLLSVNPRLQKTLKKKVHRCYVGRGGQPVTFTKMGDHTNWLRVVQCFTTCMASSTILLQLHVCKNNIFRLRNKVLRIMLRYHSRFTVNAFLSRFQRKIVHVFLQTTMDTKQGLVAVHDLLASVVELIAFYKYGDADL